MSRTTFIFIGILYYIFTIVLILVVLNLINKKERNKYKEEIASLERDKNLIVGASILSELNKVGALINNDVMQKKYDNWQARLKEIKEVEIPKITDGLIDIENAFEDKDYKSLKPKIAALELEIAYVKTKSNFLLDEIKEITLSEEKNRETITKLKSEYRQILTKYHNNKNDYSEVETPIELQFENVDKLFSAFEVAMEKNEYTEVGKIVKAIDDTIGNLKVVVEEAPSIIIMGKKLIPDKIEDIKKITIKMEKEGYNLDYLNIDYNLEESKKNIDHILDKIRVLNLEDCMFELKTMLEYFDSLFVDFEKERLSRKVYEEMESDFSKKLAKTNKVVQEVYNQLDDIKSMYDLNDKDVETIHEVNKILVVINDDYKKLLAKVEAKSTPYSMLHKEIEDLTVRLKQMEDDLDQALKSLGNMYDDEVRAREQLEEIQVFLKQCKEKMRSYKLPIITNNYFVQLSEANEAIREVIKELERKPIVIKTLNTRVDTARDLVLKLYNTTNEMIKTAQLAEMAIVFGNRYRANYDEVDSGLGDAEMLFFKGEYKKALDTSIKAVSVVDENIYRKLLAIYDK